jgi:predicted transcriptional regulator
MDIQAEKLEIMKLLLEVDSPEILREVKAVFTNKGHDFYHDLPATVKESIENGLKDIEEGRTYDHASVMNNFKTKYGLKH